MQINFFNILSFSFITCLLINVNNHQTSFSCLVNVYFMHSLYNEVVGGYIGFTSSVRLSVRPSVPRPSRIPCPLCSFYSSGWIHFIFMHLIKATSEGVSHAKFLAKFWNLKFWQFFKICNFDFVLFWLGIWCESLVWVIMGRRGYLRTQAF